MLHSVTSQFRIIILLFFFFFGISHSFPNLSPLASPDLPGSYIVEFKDDSGTHPQSDFYARLSDAQINATPRVHLSHSLFNGASFRLDQNGGFEATAKQIASLAIVKSIWPLKSYKKPLVSISQVFEEFAATGSSPLHKRQDADSYPPHVLGEVDQLRAEGYTGEGLFVALIDTGVDYYHPALGGGFGPGYKIAYGYDLVGDAYDGTLDTIPVPDDDPFSSCEGHGTHVAGILGANPNPYNFTGVVPDATLGMYRVFGCSDTTANDILVSAFMMAYEAGADIITSSIGSFSGWQEDPWAVAVSRIVAAGTPCLLSAGNDGSSGIFEASTAAEGLGILSVGSIDSVTMPANLTIGHYYTIVSGVASATQEFTYNLGTGTFPAGLMSLYALDFDTSNPVDGCSALPANTPDLSDFFVLIRRGGCNFATKAGNAQAYGARYVIFYNNVATGTLSPDDENTPGILGVAMVTAEQGSAWIAALEAGDEVRLLTSTPQASQHSLIIPTNDITGGYMSTFSSWGPTYEIGLTPVVSAPGGFILSTWPLAFGAYAVLSGTSMATPYVAGIVAIIKQVRGFSIAPAVIINLLTSTAQPVTFNDGSATRYSFFAPVIQQGAGLVRAYSAVHTRSIVQPSSISFNDTRHFLYNASFSIENTGDTAITYDLSHVPAATAYTLDPYDGLFPTPFPPDMVSNAASLGIEPSSILIEPYSSGTVNLHLTLPVGLDRGRLPMYSGYIFINGSNGEDFVLPYAGVDADLTSEATVMDTYDGFPFLTDSADPYGTPSDPNTVFTLIPDVQAIINGENTPAIAIGLALGTAFLDVDAVPEGSENYWGLGSIIGFPQTYQSGGPNGLFAEFGFWGLLATGEFVPEGNYTLLVRVLKIMGDPTCEADYEIYSTVPFEILYPS